MMMTAKERMKTEVFITRSLEQESSLLKAPDSFNPQVQNTEPEDSSDVSAVTDYTDIDTESNEPDGGASNDGEDHSRPLLRRSGRSNAGTHSNPHNLPRSAIAQEMTHSSVDPKILQSIVQSNLLILQMLSKNPQDPQ